MRYNIVLNDIAKNIICSSFSRGAIGFTQDNIFTTAKYMLATINKPAIGIELNDPNNSNYLFNSINFVDQLPDEYSLDCNDKVSFTVTAKSSNNRPISFITQFKTGDSWPLITDISKSTFPTLGDKILDNYYSYTISIDAATLSSNRSYQLRVLAAPVDRWGTSTIKNNKTVWETINTPIKTAPWTSSSIMNIHTKDCE